MARAANFAPIPHVPQEGMGPLQYQLLNALKENIELLTGTRGASPANKALLQGQVTLELIDELTAKQITAKGSGVSIDGSAVPTLDDYSRVLSDLQAVMNDLATLRNTLNALIQQLRT